MKFQRNAVPKIGCLIALAFFIFCGFKAGASNTGNVITDLGWLGTIFLYATLLMTFATMYIAAQRANAAGSKVWFVLVILVWPLSYFYTLVINRGSSGL